MTSCLRECVLEQVRERMGEGVKNGMNKNCSEMKDRMKMKNMPLRMFVACARSLRTSVNERTAGMKGEQVR